MIHDDTTGNLFSVSFELLGLPFDLAMPIHSVDRLTPGRR